MFCTAGESEKDTQHGLTYVWNRESKIKNEQNRNRLRLREQPGGAWGWARGARSARCWLWNSPTGLQRGTGNALRALLAPG